MDGKRRKQLPIMNMVRGARTGTNMGVPLGGLGGGSVTRGWRGDFNRWQLQPGIVEYRDVPADQFSVWAQRPGQAPGCRVLIPNASPKNCLQTWAWGLSADKGTYHALFPRAWTVYEEPLPGVRLTCRQVSPVIPHNYQESSLPAGVFIWTIENTAAEPVSVALMLTFQNGTGSSNDLAGGHTNHLVRQTNGEGELLAIELRHTHRQTRPLTAGQQAGEQVSYADPLTFAMATPQEPGTTATYRTRFRTDHDGKDLWLDFATDGRLDDVADPAPSLPGETIGAALAVRVEVPAGERRQVAFALSWDMPVARFGNGRGWYRRYTRFYGREGQAAAHIAGDALRQYPVWEEKIEAWQQPVLADPALPDWYKTALFNEAYYLVDGGTIWTLASEIARSYYMKERSGISHIKP
jgi:non-lysosomal glucosylceramidase